MKIVPIIITIIFTIGCHEEKAIKIESESDFNTAFNTSIWKKGNQYQRGKMATNLINSHILKNISKDSLTSLLGKPSENGEWFCNYLVSARDTSIFQNFLLVHISFDSVSNKVEDYWITD
jgi:hypothetical protein